MGASDGHAELLRRRSWHRVRATVVGLGREGLALVRYLSTRGADLTVTDRQDEAALSDSLSSLDGLSVRYALGGHPEWVLDADVIFVSPGIPRDMPLLAEATRRGVPLSSETELFFHVCPAPIIGVTGSSGKTTTTVLLGRILEAEGYRVWVGGNIGQPLLTQVTEIGPSDKVVLELSSFQLEHLRVSPHIAAILNVTPNHLDRHATMEDYTRAKGQIIAHQGPRDVAVFGRDDPGARQMSEAYAASRVGGQMAFFSAREPVERGAFLRGGQIIRAADGGAADVCPVDEIGLRGRHNLLNVLAACAVAAEAGASAGAMRQAVTRFRGVEHRLEAVRDVDGVLFVNDSIATSPERSMAALWSYQEPIVLLAGGRDKRLPWEEWSDCVVRKVRHLVLFGEAAALIERAVRAALERGPQDVGMPLALEGIETAATFDDAVMRAAEAARPGEVVLLSPGGTSYDAFVDFAQRGERFKGLVRAL